MTHTLLEHVRKLESPAVMVVVVGAEGSTPRKPGARMLVLTDGSTHGTVGGGWIEHEAVSIAMGILQGRKEHHLRTFDLRGPSAGSPMICGGSAELLFQLIPGRLAKSPA